METFLTLSKWVIIIYSPFVIITCNYKQPRNFSSRFSSNSAFASELLENLEKCFSSIFIVIGMLKSLTTQWLRKG